jgi:hypothetical protein
VFGRVRVGDWRVGLILTGVLFHTLDNPRELGECRHRGQAVYDGHRDTAGDARVFSER